ncbi:N-acetylmuramoyl-L-alanine amidase [Loktanella sp. Alg231-35]|uniref:N-acetylmuramoyl-L-alanine amidase n=1 Tax=Loktanella sp. Alg231-35 TaxID=1922220 RepID=UPI000D54EF36|nr:N-acetylmuramoyl-L-alanine amidase [Loktanella sp. Alg231-35]
MIRWVLAVLCLATMGHAQATFDPERSAVRDGWWKLEVALGLSEIVPYRVFTLDAPRRLVLDFEAVDFGGLDPDAMLSGDRATAVRFGPLRPGWSRMVIDLAEPLIIAEAGMVTHPQGAALSLVLEQASELEFAAASGAPPDPGWEVVTGFDSQEAAQIARSEDFVVVIDPGHGGIDPGASQGGIKEADLMLLLAAELAVSLAEVPKVKPVLTRNGDIFVPLSARLTIARQVGADLMISLHADALEVDEARGASVYTLSSDGGTAASQRIVERHERGDLLAGVDLSASEDRVATALMDLARAETGPAARRFADALATAMATEGVRMNTRPRREGQFAVLTAADFPSVLIEVGFLSNADDRAVLATREGRDKIIAAITGTVALLAR